MNESINILNSSLIVKDIINITAIVLSPAIAVVIGQFLQGRKETRKLKLKIFATLMSTRAAPATPSHVDALNLILIAFSGNSSSEISVRKLWKDYFDHLCNPSKSEGNEARWISLKAQKLTSLLQEMASALGFKTTDIHISDESYYPQHLANMQIKQDIVQDLLIRTLSGEKALRIEQTASLDSVTEEPPLPESSPHH